MPKTFFKLKLLYCYIMLGQRDTAVMALATCKPQPAGTYTLHTLFIVLHQLSISVHNSFNEKHVFFFFACFQKQ